MININKKRLKEFYNGFRIEKIFSKKNKYTKTIMQLLAFTVVEALVVLTILVVIAALAIPPVIKNKQEAAERNHIKKAVVDYERVIDR